MLFSSGHLCLTESELLRQPLSDVVEWFFSLSRFWRVRQTFSRNDLIRAMLKGSNLSLSPRIWHLSSASVLNR